MFSRKTKINALVNHVYKNLYPAGRSRDDIERFLLQMPEEKLNNHYSVIIKKLSLKSILLAIAIFFNIYIQFFIIPPDTMMTEVTTPMVLSALMGLISGIAAIIYFFPYNKKLINEYIAWK